MSPDVSNGDFWAGYAVTSSIDGFDEATADWTVPCYTLPTDAYQRALQWVGIGGAGGTYLWQAGTETDQYNGYRFWYEDYPTQSITYAGPSVSCGNNVNVQVDYNYTVSGKSYLLMQNYSNGQYWSTQKSFAPTENGAEWIVERPGCSLLGAPFKNFALAPTGSVNWTNIDAANTNNSNKREPITWYAYTTLTMWQDSVDLSDTSYLVSGGTGFTTYYHHAGISYCS